MRSKIIKVTRNPGDCAKLGLADLAAVKKMTNKQIEANAKGDPDNLPLTKKQLAQFKPVNPKKKVDVKGVREKLGLSQEKFAQYFGVSIRTLQEWEQHRQEPNSTARNFLLVVAKEPLAVQRALRAHH